MTRKEIEEFFEKQPSWAKGDDQNGHMCYMDPFLECKVGFTDDGVFIDTGVASYEEDEDRVFYDYKDISDIIIKDDRVYLRVDVILSL